MALQARCLSPAPSAWQHMEAAKYVSRKGIGHGLVSNGTPNRGAYLDPKIKRWVQSLSQT